MARVAVSAAFPALAADGGRLHDPCPSDLGIVRHGRAANAAGFVVETGGRCLFPDLVAALGGRHHQRGRGVRVAGFGGIDDGRDIDSGVAGRGFRRSSVFDFELLQFPLDALGPALPAAADPPVHVARSGPRLPLLYGRTVDDLRVAPRPPAAGERQAARRRSRRPPARGRRRLRHADRGVGSIWPCICEQVVEPHPEQPRARRQHPRNASSVVSSAVSNRRMHTSSKTRSRKKGASTTRPREVAGVQSRPDSPKLPTRRRRRTAHV